MFEPPAPAPADRMPAARQHAADQSGLLRGDLGAAGAQEAAEIGSAAGRGPAGDRPGLMRGVSQPDGPDGVEAVALSLPGTPLPGRSRSASLHATAQRRTG
ncbi:hypothetical protein Slala03_71970 [Streptomyces lavendulae subsp. lavendulae]|nr:hypothetical protein Slala03_71970 [Streptomyces lavendulae subsp. lavendulae]